MAFFRHRAAAALGAAAAAALEKTREEKAVASRSKKTISLHLTTEHVDALAAKRTKVLVEELAVVKELTVVTKHHAVAFGRNYYSRQNKSYIARKKRQAALKKRAARCMRRPKVGSSLRQAPEERAAPRSKKQKTYQQRKKQRHEKRHRYYLSFVHVEFSGDVNSPHARNKCRFVSNRRYRRRVTGDHAEAREQSRYKYYDQHRTSPYVSRRNQAIIDEKLECLANFLASIVADESPSSTDETMHLSTNTSSSHRKMMPHSHSTQRRLSRKRLKGYKRKQRKEEEVCQQHALAEDLSYDPMKMEFLQQQCLCNDGHCRGNASISLHNNNKNDESLTLTIISLTRSYSIEVVVCTSDTISCLKELVAVRLNANPVDLRLYFNGTALDDEDASVSMYIPSSSSGAVIIASLPLKAAGKSRKKKKSTEELLAEAAANQSKRQALLEKTINAKAKKRGLHPTTQLLRNFTQQQFNSFYAELLTMAKEVSDDTKTQCPNSGEHVPIHSILQKPSIRNIIFEIMAKSKRNFNALRFDSLETIIQFFTTNGVDITKFCDQLRACYDGDLRHANNGVCIFLKRMLLYTIRCEQGCCGKCGVAIDNLLYGAVGFESNHVADDNAESDDERIKCFNANIGAFGTGDLVDSLFEICKTRLECWKCHNHFGACNYDELPDKCVRNYDFEAAPCFVAQERVECKNALACIKDLLCRNATSRSFEYICTEFQSNTVFHYQDCFLFNEERWNAASRSTREKMLHRVYLHVEKRVCGSCLHCGETFCNLPARELGGIDLHHVIDAMKLFNPSEGVNKTIDESLKENRKLVPLCKKCHILIHHKDGENDRFMKTLKSKYGVDASLEDGQLFRIPR